MVYLRQPLIAVQAVDRRADQRAAKGGAGRQQRPGLRPALRVDRGALCVGGYRGRSLHSFPPANSQIRGEEESLVLADGTARIHVEVVPVPLRLPRRAVGELPACASGHGVEEKWHGVQLVLRNVSEAIPCKALPPDFVVTNTTAPELRPYSAFITPVITRNSATALGEMV